MVTLAEVDRHEAGTYVCTADNGVGDPASAAVAILVEYPPEIATEEAGPGGSWWVLVSPGEFWWVLVGPGGSWWVLVGFGGSWWVLVGPGGFWWALLGPGGSRGLLVGPGGPWWVLVGPAWSSMDPNERGHQYGPGLME